MEYDYVVITQLDMRVKEEIKKELVEVWGVDISKIVVPQGNIINWEYGGSGVRFLCVSVGQACNLRCESCGALAPYALPERKRYDINRIIEDVRLISENVDFIEKLQIQGGEPFLYSELGDLLIQLSEIKNIGHILIATNGTIMPDGELLNIIKNVDAEIRISEYSVAAVNADKLYHRCLEMGIQTRFYKFKSGISKWYYKGIYEMIREVDDEIVRQRFLNCKNNSCLTLENGKLTYCTRQQNADSVQGFENAPGDVFYIRQSENLKEELAEWLNNKHFVEACRYCWGTDEDYLCDPAVQIK